MARSRAKAKGRRDYGRYFNAPHSVVTSPAFRALSAQATKLWVNLMTQYNGRNNGKIAAVHSQLQAFGWARKSLERALRELQQAGFIDKTRQGGLGGGGRFCSYYRFTHLATDDLPEVPVRKGPPTLEFHHWAPPEKKLCA